MAKRVSKHPYPHFLMIVFYSSPSFLVIQVSNLKNAEISQLNPLIPWICSRFDLTPLSSHFYCQTSPKVHIPPFCWSSCSIAHHNCWWSGIMTLKMRKVFMNACSDFYNAFDWTLPPWWAIFKHKQAPKFEKSPFCWWSFVITYHLF